MVTHLSLIFLCCIVIYIYIYTYIYIIYNLQTLNFLIPIIIVMNPPFFYHQPPPPPPQPHHQPHMIIMPNKSRPLELPNRTPASARTHKPIAIFSFLVICCLLAVEILACICCTATFHTSSSMKLERSRQYKLYFSQFSTPSHVGVGGPTNCILASFQHPHMQVWVVLTCKKK